MVFTLVALACTVAVAALTREAGLALLPAACAFWLLIRVPRGKALAWVMVLAAGTTILLTPWVARNVRAMNAPVLISDSATGNFWQSHHATANGAPTVDIVAVYGPLTRRGGESDVSVAAFREGSQYALHHREQALLSFLRNVRVLYQGDRGALDWNDAHALLPFMSDQLRGVLATVSDAFYYALLLLAGYALFFVRRAAALARLVVPLVVIWTLGHGLFIAEPRYHLPLVPVMAAPAGVALVTMFRQSSRLLRSHTAPSFLHAHGAPLVLVVSAATAAVGFALLAANWLRS